MIFIWNRGQVRYNHFLNRSEFCGCGEMVDAPVSGTGDSNIMEVKPASLLAARPETLRANAPELRWGRGPNDIHLEPWPSPI
jgi:hypothetical protein